MPIKSRPVVLWNRRQKLAVAAVCSATAFAPGAAFANHGDGGAPEPMLDPDNTAHDYEKLGLTDGGSKACENGASQANRSDLNTSIGSGDVHCRDAFHGANWFGLTTCTSTVAFSGRCDHYDVDFDLSDVDSTPDTAAENNAWKYIGCHEFGHTGGLGHRTNANDTNFDSCMNQETLNITTMDQHDLDQINEDV